MTALAAEEIIADDRPSVASVIGSVSAYFSVHPKLVTGQSLAAQHCEARHVAMFVASEFGQSAAQIGRSFRRDPTSVAYAVRKVRRRAKRDQDFATTIDLLLKRARNPVVTSNRDEISRDAAEALLGELLETARARGLAAIRRSPARALARMALAFSELTGEAA